MSTARPPYTDSSGDPYEMLLDGTSEVPGTSTIPTAQPLIDLAVAGQPRMPATPPRS